MGQALIKTVDNAENVQVHSASLDVTVKNSGSKVKVHSTEKLNEINEVGFGLVYEAPSKAPILTVTINKIIEVDSANGSPIRVSVSFS